MHSLFVAVFVSIGTVFGTPLGVLGLTCNTPKLRKTCILRFEAFVEVEVGRPFAKSIPIFVAKSQQANPLQNKLPHDSA